MRIKIYLEPKNNSFQLPINYQYLLSTAVYRIFKNGSEEIAQWLHDNGYIDEKGRKIKLFNFSFLKFNKLKIDNGYIKTSGPISFIFSSPIETQLIKTFMYGILKKPIFELMNKKNKVSFNISSIELQEENEFFPTGRYKMATPATVSVQENTNGGKRVKYLHPTDERFTIQLSKNLRKKCKLLTNNDKMKDINFKINSETIQSKLVAIKENTPNEIKVKGYSFEFEMEAPEEIHRIAYYCGIGEKNSVGFGMIERINNN